MCHLVLMSVCVPLGSYECLVSLGSYDCLVSLGSDECLGVTWFL